MFQKCYGSLCSIVTEQEVRDFTVRKYPNSTWEIVVHAMKTNGLKLNIDANYSYRWIETEEYDLEQLERLLREWRKVNVDVQRIGAELSDIVFRMKSRQENS